MHAFTDVPPSFGLYLPSGQSSHAVRVLTPALYVPAGHKEHTTPSTKYPALHVVAAPVFMTQCTAPGPATDCSAPHPVHTPAAPKLYQDAVAKLEAVARGSQKWQEKSFSALMGHTQHILNRARCTCQQHITHKAL